MARLFHSLQRLRLRGALAAVATTITACSPDANVARKPSAPPAIPTVVAALTDHPSPLIRRIFVYEMLGARLEYLETLTGPAMRIDDRGVRTYKVDGCDVRAGSDHGTVGYLRLEISPTCTFDTKPFLWNVHLGPLTQITLGDFDRATQGLASANTDCLECGNGAGEEDSLGPQEFWEGSYADAQMQVLLEAASDVDIEGWKRALIAAHGEDWVAEGRFQCDEQSSNLGKAAMSKSHIAALSIGHGIPTSFDRANCFANSPNAENARDDALAAVASARAAVDAARQRPN